MASEASAHHFQPETVSVIEGRGFVIGGWRICIIVPCPPIKNHQSSNFPGVDHTVLPPSKRSFCLKCSPASSVQPHATSSEVIARSRLVLIKCRYCCAYTQFSVIEQQRSLAGTDVAVGSPHSKNVAVIGRKRSLRFPEMTPAFYVCNLAQTISYKVWG
jgi:hypothetical protein